MAETGCRVNSGGSSGWATLQLKRSSSAESALRSEASDIMVSAIATSIIYSDAAVDGREKASVQKRARRLVDGSEQFVAGLRIDFAVEVPGSFRFRRAFHLIDVEIEDGATILANLHGLSEVIRWRRLHGADDGIGIGRVGCLDRTQVMQRGGVKRCVSLVRLTPLDLLEPGRECAGRIVLVPVKAGSHVQPLCDVQTQTVDIR